ncbi:MAG: MFS transporter [Rhodocyclaceae bacterium]|nr:MFS transporter [Rhodocyclaceae bacterium]
MATMTHNISDKDSMDEAIWRAPDGHTHVTPGEIAVGVVIGRASEYFDFFVYGIASVLVFPTVFFPHKDTVEALLLSFAIFSLAFLARPFGTVLFMKLQKRWGRSGKLTAALFLLGSATVSVGFLPDYATLGGTAIFLLIVLRTLQGIAVGGTWDGLPSLLAINAPPSRRGWYAMLGQLGAPVGFVLASGLFYYLNTSLSKADFVDWGWRYPFFVAFSINVVALFARLRLVVAEEFSRMLEQSELEPTDVKELVNAQSGNILTGAFSGLATYALFHLVTIFPLSWVPMGMVETESEVLMVQLTGALLAIVAVIASGFIADRIGRPKTLAGVAVLIGIFSLFIPGLLNGDAAHQNTFILIGFILLGLSYGQAHGVVSGSFPRRFRYTGAALTADFGWLIGAAFAPLVAFGLAVKLGTFAVGAYVMSGVVCTLIALYVHDQRVARQ